MTLEELKELLSTYGANDHERGALVVVTIDGQDVPIEPDRMTVRLSIEPEPCIVCGAPIIGREGHDDGCMVAA